MNRITFWKSMQGVWFYSESSTGLRGVMSEEVAGWLKRRGAKQVPARVETYEIILSIPSL